MFFKLKNEPVCFTSLNYKMFTKYRLIRRIIFDDLETVLIMNRLLRLRYY